MGVKYPGVQPIDQGILTARNTRDWHEAHRDMTHELSYALYAIFGEVDGVFVAGVNGRDSLKAVPTVPASLQVDVKAGLALGFETAVRREQVTQFVFTAPASATRVDLVQLNFTARRVEVKAGIEGGAAPDTDDQCLALAEVTIPVGATSIKAADDGVNGYITDRRVFANE